MTSLKKKTVLIVDDYPNWRELLTELIEDDYEVTTVATFEEAQAAFRTKIPPFHVAVMDIRLVDSDKSNKGGLVLLYQEIKTKGKYTNVIVVTGYHSEDTKKDVDFLEAYAYLLKFPPEGEFNRAEYKRLVHSAADDAEKRRIENCVLIGENQKEIREQLTSLLDKEGYNVERIHDPDNIMNILATQAYSMLLLNENFLSDYRLLSKIKSQYPSIKIILITSPHITEIIRSVRNQEIEASVTAYEDGDINPQEVKEAIRRSFAFEATKYLTVKFDGFEQPKEWCVGKKYTLILSIKDVYEENCLPIWLPPQQTQTLLKVTIDAPDMNVNPDTRIPWKIFFYELPMIMKIELTPTVTGKQTISIDLDHKQFYLGRIEKEIEVI